MKRIIYIIGLFISVNVFAQTNTEKYLPNGEPKFYYDGQENKTTDPNASSNRKFELRPNYFNWTDEIFPLNSNVDVYAFSNPIFNPFRAYQQAGAIRDIASLDYQLLDFFSKDGWELISEKFGWLWNNSANPTKGAMISDPALLLYNRYTGKLRVVFALSKGATFNNLISAQVLLYQNTTSYPGQGIPNTFTISTIVAPLIPLDNKANFEDDKAIIPNINVITRFRNNSIYWMYADFQANYDPCACYLKTIYKIEVNVLSEAKIEFQSESDGTLVSTQDNIVKPKSGGISFDLSTNNIVKGVTKGYESYNSLLSFSNDVKKKNKEIADNEKANVIARYGANSPLCLLSSQNSDTREKNNNSSLDLFSQMCQDNSFVKLAKMVPYVGGAVSLVQGLFAGGSSEPDPTKVIVEPMSLHLTTKAEGTIRGENRFDIISFANPYSKEVENWGRELRPYYNNPLGVFNLLETMKIYVDDREIDTDPDCENQTPDESGRCAYRNNQLRIKLGEEFKYVINQAAGFKCQNFSKENPDIKINAAIQLDYWVYNEDHLEDFIYEHLRFVNNKNDDYIYSSDFLPIECLLNRTIEIFNEPRRVVPAPPERCDDPYHPYCYLSYPIWNLRIKNAWIKIIATLKRKDNNGQDVLFYGTYPLQMIEKELDKDDLTFQSPIEALKLTPEKQITAPINQDEIGYKDVTIQPKADTTMNGQIAVIKIKPLDLYSGTTPIKVQAGMNLTVKPNTSAGSVVIKNTPLKIENAFECDCPIIPPVTDPQVIYDFCKGNSGIGTYNYDDRVIATKVAAMPEEPQVLKGGNEINTGLYPNPVSTNFNLTFDTEERTNMTIRITNAFGVEMDKLNIYSMPGQNTLEYNCSKLNSGAYYVEIQSDTGYNKTYPITIVK